MAFRAACVRCTPAPGQQVEELPVGLRLAQSLVGNDVRGRIEHGLNRELECVHDEALLAYVLLDRLQPCHGTQIADAGLRERELLQHEVAINHVPASPPPAGIRPGSA